MSDAGLSPRRTWAQKMSDCQRYYTTAREAGQCRGCGRSGVHLRTGPHPSGERGQPLRLIGPDLDKLRKWITEAGWMCAKCAGKFVAPATPTEPVKLKPWQPYPRSLREQNVVVQRQLEIMKTGSDGEGIRTDMDVARYMRYLKNTNGYVLPEEWYAGMEQPTPEQVEQLALEELEGV